MKLKQSRFSDPFKEPTGIEGFDQITKGGLPSGRTTLLEGGPGSGKTIMALQSIVHGARFEKEPGIFVAFEESSERIMQNAAKFGWNIDELQKRKLFFLNAQPTPDLFQSGSFDLSGMLAALEAKAEEIKARRIVLDALDVVLALLQDQAAERREVYRLHDWLLAHKFTAIITAKSVISESNLSNRPQLGFLQFMVDCAVTLNHKVVEGVSQRNLRVLKYRGSAFSENESPFLIGSSGLEVAGARELDRVEDPNLKVLTERVSSGVARLDAMLGGGYYRGAGILITGFPGHGKVDLKRSLCRGRVPSRRTDAFCQF